MNADAAPSFAKGSAPETAVSFQPLEFVVVTDDEWDAQKRVRHRIPAYWAEAGARVLWIGKRGHILSKRARKRVESRSGEASLREIAQNLWVGAPPHRLPLSNAPCGARLNPARAEYAARLAKRIRHYVHELGMNDPILVLFQEALRHDLLKNISHKLSLFYANDIYGYSLRNRCHEKQERICAEKTDLIFATSLPLARHLSQFNQHVYPMPHAVDLREWRSGAGYVPEDLISISRPRVVYTGSICDKLDYALLQETARALKDLHFVFVGPVHEQIVGESDFQKLRERPNCHFLGAKPATEAPAYQAAADILILPYRRNEFTRYIGSPLKFYEYCCAQKPIVSTRFSAFGAEEDAAVWFGSTAQEWTALLEELTGRPPAGETEKQERRKALAEANSYQNRLTAQRRILESALHERQQRAR